MQGQIEGPEFRSPARGQANGRKPFQVDQGAQPRGRAQATQIA